MILGFTALKRNRLSLKIIQGQHKCVKFKAVKIFIFIEHIYIITQLLTFSLRRLIINFISVKPKKKDYTGIIIITQQFVLFPFLWWWILCITLTGQGVLTLNIISGNVYKGISGWDSHLIQWNQYIAHSSVGGYQAWAWHLTALWPSDWDWLIHHWLTRFSGLCTPTKLYHHFTSLQRADSRW